MASPSGLPSVTWKGEANRLRGNHIHLAANAACAFIWDAKLKSLKVWPPKAARSAEAQDFWAAQERLLLSSLLSLFFLEFSERIFSRLRRTFTGLSPLCVCYFLLFWRAPPCDGAVFFGRAINTDQVFGTHKGEYDSQGDAMHHAQRQLGTNDNHSNHKRPAASNE